MKWGGVDDSNAPIALPGSIVLIRRRPKLFACMIYRGKMISLRVRRSFIDGRAINERERSSDSTDSPFGSWYENPSANSWLPSPNVIHEIRAGRQYCFITALGNCEKRNRPNLTSRWLRALVAAGTANRRQPNFFVATCISRVGGRNIYASKDE